MTESGNHHPDRSGDPGPSPDAFDVLVAHPSLAGLAGRGSRLDRLPITSTGCAFLASLFVSHVAFGVAGGVVVVVMTVVPLVIAAGLVRNREVGAGRMVLRLMRGLLIAWMVAAVLAPSTSLEGSSPQAPAQSARPGDPSVVQGSR